jgi:hypothetical protein
LSCCASDLDPTGLLSAPRQPAHPENYAGKLRDEGQSGDATLMLLEMVRAKAMELSQAINCDAIGETFLKLKLKSFIV